MGATEEANRRHGWMRFRLRNGRRRCGRMIRWWRSLASGVCKNIRGGTVYRGRLQRLHARQFCAGAVISCKYPHTLQYAHVQYRIHRTGDEMNKSSTYPVWRQADYIGREPRGPTRTSCFMAKISSVSVTDAEVGPKPGATRTKTGRTAQNARPGSPIGGGRSQGSPEAQTSQPQ
ncbi:hypothetical protein GY45DRAFT_684256 [Cubamyces sp. BRFM 1775]|nr:hypothetical protein GY45DRAFT_684256 [Cubamyces sp. BRFM 1775]